MVPDENVVASKSQMMLCIYFHTLVLCQVISRLSVNAITSCHIEDHVVLCFPIETNVTMLNEITILVSENRRCTFRPGENPAIMYNVNVFIFKY